MVVDNCVGCQDQSCIKTGKICKKINNILRKEGIRRADWIRPEVSKLKRRDGKGYYREVNFSSMPKEWLQEHGFIDCIDFSK